MSERLCHLEQALLAVITAAAQRGINCDDLCAQAVGGLMSENHSHWANPEHKNGAADEIDNALTLSRGVRLQ